MKGVGSEPRQHTQVELHGQEPREPLGELQALVTGAIMGALYQASAGGPPDSTGIQMAGGGFMAIDVTPQTDERGYLPEILVAGRESGERVRVRIEKVT